MTGRAPDCLDCKHFQDDQYREQAGAEEAAKKRQKKRNPKAGR